MRHTAFAAVASMFAFACDGCAPSHVSRLPENDPVVVFPSDWEAGLADRPTPKCERICVHEIVLGCPEGSDLNCEEGCMVAAQLHARASTVSAFDLGCALAATTKDQIRKCGVRCMP